MRCFHEDGGKMWQIAHKNCSTPNPIPGGDMLNDLEARNVAEKVDGQVEMGLLLSGEGAVSW